jgi:hypothetical protein
VVDRETEDRSRDDDDRVRIERAVAIWNESIGLLEPQSASAVRYLTEGRRLDLPFDIEDVLRFHPRCPWRNENTGNTDRIPCLVAAFRSIDTDEITGIHRIRLDQPERWPKTDRRMLGVVHRSAIKLDPSGDKLVIGEGVETCLAARQIDLAPVWALGSVGMISRFPLVEGVNHLIVLGERCQANADAVLIVMRRWRAAGRKVEVAYPKYGADFNDLFLGMLA